MFGLWTNENAAESKFPRCVQVLKWSLVQPNDHVEYKQDVLRKIRKVSLSSPITREQRRSQI